MITLSDQILLSLSCNKYPIFPLNYRFVFRLFHAFALNLLSSHEYWDMSYQAKNDQGRRTLMKAINCLSYGVSCFVYEPAHKAVYSCCLNIHEEYINILHIIVEQRASYLVHLNKVKGITDQDQSIGAILAVSQLEHFIVVHTGTQDSVVFAMHTQDQKNIIWQGLLFFSREASYFYRRISEIDPFKAEAAMIFLSADSDGGNLMDMKELSQILETLRISKTGQEIQADILEINTQMYEKNNLHKPKGFTQGLLTPLGFEHLLRFYSIKQEAARNFSQYCPIFKMKKRSNKNSIMQILKNNQKPIMCAYQLKDFYLQTQKIQKSQQQCLTLIKSFPVYDGQGREKDQETILLSFSNFCNIIFSNSNDIVQPEKLKLCHDMTLPLTDYYIYSSKMTYLERPPADQSDSLRGIPSKLQMIDFALKKGCRGIQLDIYDGKNSQFEVGLCNPILLQDALKAIMDSGFSISQFPIILTIGNHCSAKSTSALGSAIQEVLEGRLYIPIPELIHNLPSPQELKGKVILLGVPIQINRDSSTKPVNSFNSMIALAKSKFDFERKGQNIWSVCDIQWDKLVQFEELEELRLGNYSRKILLRSHPSTNHNYNPLPMLRMGCQMIAMNLQTTDANNLLLHSLFRQNKGCGYLIKPKWMQGNCSESRQIKDFQNPVANIQIEVLEGQRCLTLAQHGENSFYLEVYLKGTKSEQSANRKVFKSEVFQEGFYSKFLLKCEFTISCPDVCVIVMNITDGKMIFASRSVRAEGIRQGLRAVRLLNRNMEFGLNSYLLVDCKISQISKKKQVFL